MQPRQRPRAATVQHNPLKTQAASELFGGLVLANAATPSGGSGKPVQRPTIIGAPRGWAGTPRVAQDSEPVLLQPARDRFSLDQPREITNAAAAFIAGFCSGACGGMLPTASGYGMNYRHPTYAVLRPPFKSAGPVAQNGLPPNRDRLERTWCADERRVMLELNGPPEGRVGPRRPSGPPVKLNNDGALTPAGCGRCDATQV
jgi:hypothetical protein